MEPINCKFSNLAAEGDHQVWIDRLTSRPRNKLLPVCERDLFQLQGGAAIPNSGGIRDWVNAASPMIEGENVPMVETESIVVQMAGARSHQGCSRPGWRRDRRDSHVSGAATALSRLSSTFAILVANVAPA